MSKQTTDRMRPVEPDWEAIVRKSAASLPSVFYHDSLAIRDAASLLAEAYQLGLRDALRWEIYHEVG